MCDFTHAYWWNKWITLSHPFSRVVYKTVIAVDISLRSLFIIAECVLQAYKVCFAKRRNFAIVAKWLNQTARHTGRTMFLACSVKAIRVLCKSVLAKK